MPKDFDLPRNADLFLADQMLKKARSDDAQDDEHRLFGNYENNSNAVKITPGDTFRKPSKRSSHGFSPYRPIDTISRNSRQSGPVRAQGKVKHRDDQVSVPATSSRYRVLADVDEGSRPAKRQRRGNLETTSSSVINLVDDDEMVPQMSPTGTSTSAPQHASRPSSISSQQSVRAKMPRSAGNEVDEYRNVEKLMSNRRNLRSPQNYFHKRQVIIEDDQDSQPTPATRPQNSRADVEQAETDRSKHGLKQEILQSVEICNRGVQREMAEAGSPKPRKQLVSTDSGRRTSDLRESPDELQGDITVQRAPSSLNGAYGRDVSIGSQSADRSGKDIHRPSSPNDIRPTNFTSRQGQGKTNRKVQKGEKGVSHKRLFEASLFRFGPVERISSDGLTFEVTIDNTRETIGLVEDVHHDIAEKVSIPLQKIMSVLQGESPSRKVRLRLSKMEGTDEKMDIELSSEKEKDNLCNALKKHVGIQLKESAWMDKAFAMSERNAARRVNGYKRPSTESLQEPVPEPEVETVKRPKLSASLQDSAGSVNHKPGMMINRPPRRPMETSIHERNSAKNPDPDTHSHPARNESDQGVTIPVKKFTPKSSNERETRSKSRRALTSVISDDKIPTTGQSASDYKLPKWSRALVYPRVGKKKAEVDVHDLERLHDGEFLNDNLIGFYLRFLEYHLERTSPDIAKRIYFFNSYFFATLTNLPRGKRGINYEGVQKWTRNVDIFSHDYVVVPINENAHWYVAIICNLPNLQRTLEDSPEFEGFPDGERVVSSRPKLEERLEIPETPPAVTEDESVKEGEKAGDLQSDSGKEEKTRQSLASMTLSDIGEAAVPSREDVQSETVPEADGDWPEGEENPASSPPKFATSGDKPHVSEKSKEEHVVLSREEAQTGQRGKKQKKKTAPSLPKYDPKQPVIITFDSLDLTRSPTIRCLREYLYEEGKSKRAIEVDTKTIKGMTARGIPLQPNFSDCGLYLLAYMEKFVQDPDVFISKLLQREMRTDTDWPPMKSGLLRRRLRKFLDQLYEEQEQIKRRKASEENTLADEKMVSFLLGASGASQVTGSDENASCQPAQSDRAVQKSTDNKPPSKKDGSSGEQTPCDGRIPEEPMVTVKPSKGDSSREIPAKDIPEHGDLEQGAPEQVDPRQAAPEQDAPSEEVTVAKDKTVSNPASEDIEEITRKRTQSASANAPSPRKPVSDRVVIEVPESQSPAATTPSSPRHPHDVKAGKNSLRKRQGQELTEEGFLDELGDYINTESNDTARKVTVEVQVPGTPPPSTPSALVRDSPRRSPRQARQRNKENEDRTRAPDDIL